MKRSFWFLLEQFHRQHSKFHFDSMELFEDNIHMKEQGQTFVHLWFDRKSIRLATIYLSNFFFVRSSKNEKNSKENPAERSTKNERDEENLLIVELISMRFLPIDKRPVDR